MNPLDAAITPTPGRVPAWRRSSRGRRHATIPPRRAGHVPLPWHGCRCVQDRDPPYTPGGSRSGSPLPSFAFLNLATVLSRLAISLVAWPVHARLPRRHPRPRRRLRRRHGRDARAVRPHRRRTTRPAGQCHEALVLNRPDVIEGVHESMVEAGAEVVETDTFQATRLKLDEWGLGEHTLEINRKAAEIARKAVGEDRFVAGSIGPTGFLPASDDPTLGQIRFRELVEVFAEQAQGLLEGGVDLLIIETAQDILEVKAAIFGAREAFKARRAARCRSRRQRLAAAQRRQDAARHRHQRRADHARGAEGRRRSASTARPAPRTCATRSASSASTRPLPGPLHPERRHPAPGPRRRDDLPRGARAARRRRSASSSSATASTIVGGCCGTTPEHIRAIAERCAGHTVGPRPAPRPPHVSSSMIAADAARAGARARRSSASASTRRARARPRSCCWPTTTTASCRSPRTRSRAARTCSTSASR